MTLWLRLALVGITLIVIGCTKSEVPKEDPAVLLKDFIPAGWMVEYDTLAPLLDGGRQAHLVVLSNYDSSLKYSSGRMVLVIGKDKNGKLQRYGANKSLLPKTDVSSDAWIPSMSDMIRLKKDVITIVTHASGGATEAVKRQEQFKIRFDPTSKRMKLIGYDLIDNTDGFRTVDSRNYLAKRRVIQQTHAKDTLFKRTLSLRHTGPFLEDLEPWTFAIETGSLKYASGPLPESNNEIVSYDYPDEPADTTATYDDDGVAL